MAPEEIGHADRSVGGDRPAGQSASAGNARAALGLRAVVVVEGVDRLHLGTGTDLVVGAFQILAGAEGHDHAAGGTGDETGRHGDRLTHVRCVLGHIQGQWVVAAHEGREVLARPLRLRRRPREIELPQVAVQIARVDALHLAGRPRGGAELDHAGRHAGCHRVADRQRQLEVVRAEHPGGARRLGQVQQEQGGLAARTGMPVRRRVVDPARHHGERAVRGGGCVRGAGPKAQDLRPADHVAEVEVVAVGEFPQHLAGVESRGIAHVQRVDALSAGARAAHEHGLPCGGAATDDLGLGHAGRRIDEALVRAGAVGGGGQERQARAHPARDVGEQFGARGGIERVQHAVVGSGVHGSGPALVGVVEAAVGVRAVALRGRPRIDDAGVDHVTEAAGALAKEAGFVLSYAADEIQALLAQAIGGAAGRRTIQLFLQALIGSGPAAFDLVPTQFGGGPCAAVDFADEDLAEIGIGPVQQCCGRPQRRAAHVDGAICSQHQGRRDHIAAPAVGIEAGLIDGRAAGTDFLGRHRAASNAVGAARDVGEHLVQAPEDELRTARQIESQRIAARRARTFPAAVVDRLAVLAEKGVAEARTVLETSVLRGQEVFAAHPFFVLTAPHLIVVLVHVERIGLHSHAWTLLAGAISRCPGLAANVVRGRPVRHAGNVVVRVVAVDLIAEVCQRA